MRTESDALGSRQLEDDVYYGIQTQRALENFAISNTTVADIPGYVASIVTLKKAAALANCRIGALDADVCRAICRAAEAVLAAPDPAEFPVDIYQGGGGTPTNMNVNEVLANRANELLTGVKGYDAVHPNTHVNMGQSTNDVIPSAMKLTMHGLLGHLQTAVAGFAAELRRKEEAFADVVKVGRTCLQDALPITLGQQLSGYRGAFERAAAAIGELRPHCLELPMGATAIGTGFGTFPGYGDALVAALREETGLPVGLESNLFDGLQNADFWISVSAVLKITATHLNKLASDLRIVSSGPRAGLSELRLPAVQPGSSIMPGKVNPVMPEMAMQVYFRVLGNDVSVSRACEGELDLNVWESLILHCLAESTTLLTACLPLMAEKCIRDLAVNREVCRANAERSLALSTAIATEIDYPTASKLAKQAEREGKSVKDVAVETGLLSAERAEALLDPLTLTSPGRFNALFVGKARREAPAEHR